MTMSCHPRHFAGPLCAHFVSFTAAVGQESLAPPADTSGVTVELIEAGAAPRAALRFRPTKGLTGTVVMEMNMEQTTAVGGNRFPAARLPGQRYTIQYSITDVASSGDIQFEYEYTDIKVIDDPDNPSPIAAQVEQMTAPLKGATGSATVTSRGFTKSADLEVPPDVAPQMRALLEGMKQSMERLSLPMPEEEIGLGGKWKVTQDLVANGVQLQQTSTCELTGADNDQYSVNIQLLQQANKQQVNAPGVPPGAEVMLESLKSTGKGRLVLSPSSVFPVDSSMNIDSETKINVTAGGNTQAMVTNMKMELTIRPAESDPAEE